MKTEGNLAIYEQEPKIQYDIKVIPLKKKKTSAVQ